MNTKERTEIWKEYFDQLLNTEEPKELFKIGNRIMKLKQETYYRRCKNSKINLKNNNVGGTDGIHQELINQGGTKLQNRIYELVSQICQEERIPEEWEETIIVPI